jgi:hypothetical protein
MDVPDCSGTFHEYHCAITQELHWPVDQAENAIVRPSSSTLPRSAAPAHALVEGMRSIPKR